MSEQRFHGEQVSCLAGIEQGLVVHGSGSAKQVEVLAVSAPCDELAHGMPLGVHEIDAMGRRLQEQCKALGVAVLGT